MSYFVDCSCGRRIDVVKSQAGSSIGCVCGAALEIPPLTQLKQQVGEDHLSPLDRIGQMLRDRQLPQSRLCAYSGMPTRDVIYIAIECERVWTRNSERGLLNIVVTGLSALFGHLAHLFHQVQDDDEQVMGRATGVSVPLRVAHEFEKQVRGSNQSELKRLLRTVPIYARLLDDYPEASVRAMWIE
jgi:hypothetical protein